MHSRVAESARNELAEQIKRVHQEGYKPMNPITETVGIINLERSVDPNQNALGQVMLMLEQLTGDLKVVQASLRDLQLRSSAPNPLDIKRVSGTVPGLPFASDIRQLDGMVSALRTAPPALLRPKSSR